MTTSGRMKERYSSILLLFILFPLTGCFQQQYLGYNQRQQMMAPLVEHINQQTGSPYGDLILKLDLLQLEPGSSHSPAACTENPEYMRLIKSDISEKNFQSRLQLLEANFEQENQQGNISSILRVNTAQETTILSRIVTGSSLFPQTPAKTTPSLAALASISELADSVPVLHPFNHSEISSGFAVRNDPINGKKKPHEGIDFRGELHSPIVSAANGIVIRARPAGTYGNMIVIDHGHNITTRYAHLDSFLVHEGDKVAMGQVIGTEGKSGRVTGPHLHYEVRLNNVPRNPWPLIKLGSGCY